MVDIRCNDNAAETLYVVRNSLMRSCTYLVHGGAGQPCFLVDCGDAPEIISYIRENSLQLQAIFLTHCHFDHIYGINEVSSAFPDAVVYGSCETIDGLYDARLNISLYNEMPYTVSPGVKTRVVSSDSDILIGGRKLEILETPGHDTGCLSYRYGSFLFTGDSYIPFVPVFAKWKRSDKKLARKNETLLKAYAEVHGLQVLCGHYEG